MNEKDLPKAMNCRLKVSEDLDIMEDLHKHGADKTARIKEVYRMGLRYEAERSQEWKPHGRKEITVRIPKPLIKYPKH